MKAFMIATLCVVGLALGIGGHEVLCMVAGSIAGLLMLGK